MADIEAQKEAWILEAVQRMQQLTLQPGGAGNQNAAAAESQRLADVKQLTPTATARAAVPAYILASLPADVKQLLQGTAPVPLLPMHHLMVSQILHSMLLGAKRAAGAVGRGGSSRGGYRGGSSGGRGRGRGANGRDEGSSSGAGAARS